MSSCLSGGGSAYKLDIEFIKSPTASWTSNSSSPSSSTLSESRNSPLSISTRKARTPRKRPNQISNEAAAILSTAYPKLFPTKHLTKPCKFTYYPNPFSFEPSDLLMPFQVMYNSGCLLQFHPILERSNSCIESKGLNSVEKACHSPGEISSWESNPSEICEEYREDFNTKSILNEEIGEGIDSIMGKLCMENKAIHDYDGCSRLGMDSSRNGFPVGLDSGHGIRRELRAMRNDDEGDWWRFPGVNVADITKKIAKMPVGRKTLESIKEDPLPSTEPKQENVASTASGEDSVPRTNPGLLLKLNYDDVLNAWAEKGSPFCDDSPASESAGNDVQVRLAQVDLFSEKGEESDGILVNNQRRRTRHSSKKVRAVNSSQRPRLKGRYARKPNCPNDEEG